MAAGPSSSGVEIAVRDGARVSIRPIRPEDEPQMAVFHAGLSARSVYQRYFHVTSLEQRVTHARLALTCRVDPAVGLALVAVHEGGPDAPEVVGLGRLTRTQPADTAEIALLVRDDWQGRGLGGGLMQQLLADARAVGVRRVYGDMLADNDAMQALVRRAGFTVRPVPGDAAVLRAERALDNPAATLGTSSG